ncbi:NAD(P)/FAD-dependent oxidoreductase, partial [bacterium]|nr:NAD(P)/FAD-dependent oxidoreductase [bacterium]
MNYIIIGNGVAGTEAAITIRKNDTEGRIKIISESPGLFYYRPKIIDLLEDKTTVEKMTIYKEEFYKSRNIECLVGGKVVSINPDENCIALDSERITYDKLLLATGASCFVPPINGSEKKGVFTLRTTEDAQTIKEYCRDVESVLFIGGGLLGLETACSLLNENQKGTVVEFFPRLLPRQLDEQGAGFLKKKIEDSKDLRFILNDSVAEIKGKDSVTGVILKSGEEISFQAVVISAGVRPRVELAEEAGIIVDRGIIVNDYL